MYSALGGLPSRKTLEDFENYDPPFLFTSLRKSRTHTVKSHSQLLKQLQVCVLTLRLFLRFLFFSSLPSVSIENPLNT